MIALRLAVQKDSDDGKKSLLVVTCEDTAPAIKLQMYEYLFEPPKRGVALFEGEFENDDNKSQEFHPELCLFSVACEMNVIGGEYGFRPRSATDEGCRDYDKEVGAVSGSLFWFCIPCSVLKESAMTKSMDLDDVLYSSMQHAVTREDAVKFQQSISGMLFHQRKKRALVIEDSNVIRKMLTKILSNLGFDVSQAENGMDGLAKLKSSLFDLVLCDFLMPVMDGLDCVQQYRDWEKYHRPWIKQRIVGISAHATAGDIERGKSVGLDDYRNKPVTVKVLSELINCEGQVEMSNRLDEIERREENVRSTAHSESMVSEGSPMASLVNGRPCACLLVAPISEHIKSMQDLIKSSGWQSTVVGTEGEVLTLLKMRMWDLVLVDETFAPCIGAFRDWERKKRKTLQKSVTLMTDTFDIHTTQQTLPPNGIDALTAKPMSLHSLGKLLHRTYFALEEEATNCTAS
ncbi:response regulator receiver domain containing protein [Nitzschia inconspicua]|uniref:Response regulator receiver domain containing protein n=1 Tax=Nitzschia inconspicua TaxID=303405 RepID=A0A9K3KMT0_9STRA|nr:response regulator receiver domain containing protein [Nitzschia inconspicua]